jgi:hypothetical protein
MVQQQQQSRRNRKHTRTRPTHCHTRQKAKYRKANVVKLNNYKPWPRIQRRRTTRAHNYTRRKSTMRLQSLVQSQRRSALVGHWKTQDRIVTAMITATLFHLAVLLAGAAILTIGRINNLGFGWVSYSSEMALRHNIAIVAGIGAFECAVRLILM